MSFTSFSCPSTYIWKPAVSLCYKNIEDTHKWSEGDVTCTAAGGRLAILNTQEKLLSVKDDYNAGGVLFSEAYHIGGQFVGGVGWQWVDGTPVDPSLLNSYSISGVDGDCLFWNSLYLLIQDKCDTSERILCEQVPPVI
ncbi:killer cell lectin-like receptor subfamily B member 1B allele A [Crassostrea virginica]